MVKGFALLGLIEAGQHGRLDAVLYRSRIIFVVEMKCILGFLGAEGNDDRKNGKGHKLFVSLLSLSSRSSNLITSYRFSETVLDHPKWKTQTSVQ